MGTFIEKIKINKEKFLEFNNTKLQRFQDLIHNDVKRVINSIPLLLCINDSKIPGYVEGNTPVGIPNYEPDKETNKYIKARFHVSSFDFDTSNPCIEMLAVMGSVGTIAYTKKSDFDYWVCIDKQKMSDEMINNLQKKINAIQEWAIKETKIDVHLFMNDIENLKNNIYAEDESEAFGSTIGATLKDEFFRSSIIIAGKIPFWWVTPRIRDSEYEKLFNQLDDEMKDNDFFDLGNLYQISKEDFLGAALFQLIKSLGNPFKSIIKIGVLEKYLFGPENSSLLCQKVKSNIIRGNLDNNILDSYILMFEEVYDYYNSILEDKKLLMILRQNLYLKINPQLSKYRGIQNSKNLPYKVMVMFKYMQKWKWTGKRIQELDDFENWDYNKIITFWNLVKKFMLLSYQKIANELPALNLKQKISSSDFKLLSRKIKTHFSSEVDKIDYYITFKDTPYESVLYIEPINKGIKEVEWRLYKRNTSSKDKFASTTLKTEPSLIKLLAWSTINQIFDPTFSRLKIQSGYTRINQNLMVELLTQISNLFIKNRIYLTNEYFLKPAINLKNMVIINFNLENADSVQSIHHLYLTSWGEAFINEYKLESDIAGILNKILNDGQLLKQKFDDYCIIATPEPYKKLYKGIITLFRESYEFFVLNDTIHSLRIITKIGDQYVIINRDGGKISLITQPNPIKMLATVTLRPKKDVIHKFFGDDARIKIMDSIYSKNKKNSISIIFEEKGEFILIYILNERGNIFTFVKPQKDKEKALMYLYDFTKNIIDRINNENLLPNINEKIFSYRFQMDKFGKHSFTNETHNIQKLHLLKAKPKGALAASITRHKGTDTLYSIQSSDNSSTDFMPLNQLPKNLNVLIRNNKGESNNFIQDIKFTDLKLEDLKVGTTLFYLEKYRLEYIIDKIK